ncbi:hypothetical protein NCCP2495_05440 [Dietzia sp. NCCP-2495]|uniref:hypothetical protein n=1 Tax=Dietzia sp. NCCP-2495 TaxID=2934675 RepID=UPI0022318013|nr:hypothetical protein [Dietzia sp. NCCP-2495]GLB62666.1 hypothetical protein NCCP2495_05440 [Dietzia sp. NCCP-2495]
MAINDEIWRQVNRSKPVRQAEKRVAEQLAARARAITAAEGGKAKIRVEAGIRPGGRSRVNVVSDSPWEEYGTESTKRIRALGRAAREV